MNIYLSIGIIAITLGTILMTQIIGDGKLVVLGAIIYALGLFWMTKGSLFSSKKDQSELIEKFNEFKEELAAIKGEVMNKDSLDKIEKIEHEFDEWAETFVRNIEGRKVEREKNKILLKEKEINLSKKWRHIYQYAFELIKQILTAYYKKAKDNIAVLLPELPHNLFGKEAKSFKGSVVFSESAAWVIRLVTGELEILEDSIPIIMIYFYFAKSPGENVRELVEKEGYTGKVVILSFDLENESLNLMNSDRDLKIANRYSISADNYKNSLKDLFTALIEFQIINL